MGDEFYDEEKPRYVDKTRELELLNLRNQMKTEVGRGIMWRILSKSRIFMDIYDPDPIVSAYNSGSRSQGLWLESELKQASFGYYLKMIEENGNGG